MAEWKKEKQENTKTRLNKATAGWIQQGYYSLEAGSFGGRERDCWGWKYITDKLYLEPRTVSPSSSS